MPVEQWSDDVVVVHLGDDPQFTEDLESLDRVETPAHVVLDLSAVHFANSSNIARLLRLRTRMRTSGKRLILCNFTNQVWGVFITTGLDKIFDMSENVPTALATLQLAESGDA